MSQSSHQKNIISDTLKYVPATLIRVFAGFMIVPLLTRMFDAEAYGQYAFALSVLTIMQMFVGSWINVAIVRFYAQSEVKNESHILTDSILAVTLIFSVSVSFIGLIVVILIKPVVDPVLFHLLLLIPLALISSSIIDLPLQTLRAKRSIGLYSILSTAITILVPFTGVLISMMLNGAVIGLVIGMIVIQLIMLIIAFRLCYESIPVLKYTHRDYMRNLIVFGLPLVPSAMFDTIFDISDRFILTTFRGSAELGIYAVNYTISWTIISLMGTLLSQSSGPLIVSIWEREGRKSTELIVSALLRSYLMFVIPSVIGISMIGSELATLLLAPEYVKGAEIYPYIAGGALFMGIQWIAQRGIILSNRTDIHLKSFFIGGLCNILLNFALVPPYGYLGAAIATLIASIVLMGVVAYFSAQYITISISWLSIIRIIVSCGVMIIVSQFIPDFEDILINIVITCLVSGLSYLIMLIVLREWTVNEIMQSMRYYRIIK